MGMGCSAEQCTCARTEADRGTDRVDEAPPPSSYATAGLGNKENVAPAHGGSLKAEGKDKFDLRLPASTAASLNQVQRLYASPKGFADPPNVVGARATVERSSEASSNSLVTIALTSTRTLDQVGDSLGVAAALPEALPNRSGKQGSQEDAFVGMEPTWTAHYSAASTDSMNEEFVPNCSIKPDTSKKQQRSDDQVELQVFLNANNFDGNDLNRPRTSMLKTILPLHAAINQGRPDIVESLLQAKADPTKKTSSGQTSWKLARSLKSEMAAEVLALLGEEPENLNETKASGVFGRFSHKRNG